MAGEVILGDALEGMERLDKETFDCVYADPDYNVGVNYNGKRYKRSFEEYIEWCSEWSREAHRLLKPTGNFFVVNYPRNNAYLWASTLDELYHDVQEYVWVYNTNVGHSPKRFTTAHRSVLHCRKTNDNNWFKDQVAQPYKNPTDKRIRRNIANGSKGRMPYSWLYYNLVKNVSREKTNHVCQIPQKLSELLFKASMKKGDKVLVMFGGSGSEVLVATRLGLEYTTFEIDPKYHKLILKRIKRVETAVREGELKPLTYYTEPLSQTQ
ncbi:MAG: site-specific DNA-methyltransferase [Candidatus Thermoplasmatota archaeon]|nr:site-specific DNA-methyltransferase [Candidatus Thermoplasmatota archaeon]